MASVRSHKEAEKQPTQGRGVKRCRPEEEAEEQPTQGRGVKRCRPEEEAEEQPTQGRGVKGADRRTPPEINERGAASAGLTF